MARVVRKRSRYAGRATSCGAQIATLETMGSQRLVLQVHRDVMKPLWFKETPNHST